MPETTRRIAAFAAAAEIPDAVRDVARKPFIDTVGCILSGATSEVAAPLTRYVAAQHGHGASAILGTALRAPPEIAAFVNGTFGHALDFDDGIVLAPVHPSSVVVAALLADPVGITGRQLLDAYIVGIEVAVRLAVGIGIEHYHRGWHGTGTIGIFGAVAALAHARKLPVEVTQTAFGLAASMASGVQRNFGTMGKPLHTGWAARNAVTAVELARSGFTAATDVMEAKSGFFAVYGSAGSNPELTVSALGSPFAIADPGLSLKRYACCYASHRPIEGLLALRSELALDAGNVKSVQCVLAPGSLRALIYPRPRTGLEGKFSLEYALAAGVLDGAYTLWTFGDEAVARPAAQALLPRITISEDARCAVGDTQGAKLGPSRRGFVELSAERLDGKRATTTVHKLPGSPDQPLTRSEVDTKFLDCAAAAQLDCARAEEALQRLGHLESERDVSGVLELLRR